MNKDSLTAAVTATAASLIVIVAVAAFVGLLVAMANFWGAKATMVFLIGCLCGWMWRQIYKDTLKELAKKRAASEAWRAGERTGFPNDEGELR